MQSSTTQLSHFFYTLFSYKRRTFSSYKKRLFGKDNWCVNASLTSWILGGIVMCDMSPGCPATEPPPCWFLSQKRQYLSCLDWRGKLSVTHVLSLTISPHEEQRIVTTLGFYSQWLSLSLRRATFSLEVNLIDTMKFLRYYNTCANLAGTNC